MEAITREEKLMDGQYVEPITREEKILAGEDIETVTRREYFLKKYRGGGGDISVVQLSVNENGTYTAPSGKAYSPVNVEVPTPENAYFLKSVAGLPSEIASFSDGASMPLKELEVSIEPIQSGSGEPSPDNVRPISGWTECNVTRCDNLFDKNSPIERGQYVSGSFQNTNVRITSDYIEITPNTNYMMNVDHLGTKDLAFINYAYFDASKNYLGNRIDNGDTAFSGERTKEVNISNSSAKYIRVTFRGYSNTDKDLSSQTLVDSGFVFAPYDSTYTTYTIQFTDGTNPLTVYGGTLDVTTGVLTVDRVSLDMGSLSWSYDSGIFYANMQSYVPKPKYKGILLSPIYVNRQVPLTNPIDYSIYVANSDAVPIIRVADSRYTDATTYTTAMNGVQLVYELATPQTYSLNPTAVMSILRRNNVSVDTGEVNEVQYLSKEV